MEQLSNTNPREIIWYSCFTNVLEKNPQIFLASVVEKVVQACHPPWKWQRGGKVKWGFVSCIQPERHCHHQLSLLQTYLTGFSKVNRGLTQWDWDTCSFPTTGNKFARQACKSQIKHALFGMIYECNVVLGALGCEELRVWRWWGGSRWGWWVGECQICLTGRLICSCSEGAHCNTHLCH